ncbi:quinol dehydrogenase ferredoxin subunit NapH [Novispirillum sp. DQ9]|uniref:quinol dehydrogenase ferredoxin subunit NapH n=1 Tax=Novispirillum sp. DQ9 TaxID=3398612 RepID=UPI003C7E6A67
MTAPANPVSRQRPAALAVAAKGRLAAHKWLLLRRLSQLGVLGLFLSGPLLGLWVLKGTLASSTLFDTVPFTDPLLFVQSLAAGQDLSAAAWIGVALLVGLYMVFGGRSFCAWICPVNLLTDGAHAARVHLGIRGGLTLARSARWWLLGVVVGVSALSGVIAWESLNPVTLLHRELVFGIFMAGSLAWMLIVGVVLFDTFAANRGWCGHLCPVGAAYGLIGKASLTRVSARDRDACDQCQACYHVCPEPHVLTPALKGTGEATPLVLSGDCTNCGRCIDVCHRDVFAFTHRFDRTTVPHPHGSP